MNDAGDLLGVFWEGDSNGGYWSVQIVNWWCSQVKEGVALESHETRVLADCRQETVMARDTMSMSHLERTPRSREGVDGVEVGLSDGEVSLNAKGFR
jgi:hypothetical protein